MRSIKFDNKKITVTYNTPEEAKKATWIFYNHEESLVDIENNILTFYYRGHRYLGAAIRDIISKTFKDLRTKKWVIDRSTHISEHFEAIAPENKLFKITLINSHQTIGESGFGCWQYGRILTLDNVDGLKVSLRNSNLDEFRHELTFKDDITVIIEIGEIQFQ